MKKYWEILKKYKWGLISSPLLVLIFVFCETIQPKLMADIVDNGVMKKDISEITQVGIVMVLISLLGLIANIINIYVSSHTSIGFSTDLRKTLFNKIQQMSFAEIDTFGTSSLITRLTNDVSKIQQVILFSMRMMLRAPMMVVMATFFAISINSELAMIILASIPILAISIYVILKIGFPLFVKVQQKVDNLNNVIRENLINIRVVKSFVREDFETKKFTKSSEDLKNIVIKASNTIVTIFPIMQTVLNFSIIAILWYGGDVVINQRMQVGELVSFVNYIAQILMSLMMVSVIIMIFARATASYKRINEVLYTEPSIRSTQEALRNNFVIENGNIHFKDVYFKFPNSKNNVLKHIDLTINAGETIALVGATGSAKTALVQLIPRLYDVTKGQLLIDHKDVKDYTLKELHAKVGMVLQNNELFTGTIIENIRWGKPEASQMEIDEAAKSAQAYDFITNFPDGYDTVLGRGGINVSGGQKQRICIARALLRKPKILILDDSTSAVDTDTERRIRSNLKQMLKDTTVIMITQRVNTMQSADRIVVLDNGEIEAVGTPDELLDKSHTYREIFYSQQLS